MHIGNRLTAVAGMVPEGAVLADIGTDHAYLPVKLALEGRIKRAIASDVAKGPCNMASSTVKANGLEGLVEVRQGDGLKSLRPGEADCIAIAGMGAGTIIEILESSLSVAQAAGTLVLQPMTGAGRLRRWLARRGWKLVDEELAEESGRLYEILRAARGESGNLTMAECALGPILIAKGHPLLEKKLKLELEALDRLLEGMGKSAAAAGSERYGEARSLKAQLEVLRDERFGNGRRDSKLA